MQNHNAEKYEVTSVRTEPSDAIEMMAILTIHLNEALHKELIDNLKRSLK